MKLINKDDMKAFALTVLAVAVAAIFVTPIIAGWYGKLRAKVSA